MTAHADLDHAVAAYQGGAFEYLPKPFDIDEAVALVRRAATQGEGGRAGHGGRRDRRHHRPGAGDAGRVPRDRPPVALEPVGARDRRVRHRQGTGRARAAPAQPARRGPFIALNTSAIASDLLESELFGHEHGAFTGADSQRRGRFEQADGGTLFLDEIGDMSAALQTRLLRVLAEGEFYRVGGNAPIRVDVRVIAATHQDLDARVKQGRFREDLLHRLNVIRIRVPSLRERRGDIPELLVALPGAGGARTRRRAEDARRARAEPARRLRLARQRAPARQCRAAPDGDGARPRDPRRGHSRRSRRRQRGASGVGRLVPRTRGLGVAASRGRRRAAARSRAGSSSSARSPAPRSRACRAAARKRRG